MTAKSETPEHEKIPRDENVCFWCRYLDHSGPHCRRRAPVAMCQLELEGDPQGRTLTPAGTGAWWPTVDPASDWCGDFVAGDASETLARAPQESDLDYAAEMQDLKPKAKP